VTAPRWLDAAASVGILGAIAQPNEGVSVSWEGLTAIGGLVLAALAILALVWRGGQLSQQLDSTRDFATQLGEKVSELEVEIGGLSRVIYELRGSFQASQRTNSRPPIGRDDDD
jgi:hypothetical protein